MARASSPSPSPLAAARPLFLLGAPRAGTTFVARLVNAHPAVLVTDEVRVFTFFEHAFREIPTGHGERLHSARSHGAEFVAALREYVAPVVTRTFEHIATAQGRRGLRYWGDKNPHHVHSLPLIEACFPTACYLRVRRDPRDVVCSIAELHGTLRPGPLGRLRRALATRRRRSSRVALGVGDTERLRRTARTVGESIRRSVAFLDALPADRVLEVGYEALLAEPERGLPRLFTDFLGLDDLSAPRRWLAEQGRHDSHGRFTEEVDFGRRSVGRWRRDLTAAQARVVGAALGDALARDRAGRD